MASIPPTALPVPAPTAPAITTAAPKSKATTKTKTVTKATGAAGTQAKAKKPASRKKPTGSSTTNTQNNKTNNSSTAAQSILQQAKMAQADVARQKAQAEARRLDPLWYRTEDLLMTTTTTTTNNNDTNATTTTTTTTSTVLPEQASIVEQVLATYGLGPSDVTPQAMTCLLEHSRRLAQEFVGHAQEFAFSANRLQVLDVDLQLAAKLRPDYRLAVSAQLPQWNQLAQHINRAPLPPIPSHCYSGVVLPSPEHQLTARTYDIVSGARVQSKQILPVPVAPTSSKKKSSAAVTTPSYGATKGRPIPIQLKTTTATTAMDVSLSPSKTNNTAVAPMDATATTAESANPTVATETSSAVVVAVGEENVAAELTSTAANVVMMTTQLAGTMEAPRTALDSATGPSVLIPNAPPPQEPVPMDTTMTTTIESTVETAPVTHEASSNARMEETTKKDETTAAPPTVENTSPAANTEAASSGEPAGGEHNPTMHDELEPPSMDLN